MSRKLITFITDNMLIKGQLLLEYFFQIVIDIN